MKKNPDFLVVFRFSKIEILKLADQELITLPTLFVVDI